MCDFQLAQSFGTHLARGMAAGTVGVESRFSFLVEDRFGHDRPGRISGAEEEYVIALEHGGRLSSYTHIRMRVRLRRHDIYVNTDVLYTYAVPRESKKPTLDALFRALADPTRLRLLNLTADREICVCYFVEILKISQPKVSRHLAYLRRAGIVASRREGKWMHYRLAKPSEKAAAAILQETLKHLKVIPEMRRDISRLDSACCAPQKYELPQTAPQPVSVASTPGR
jgi:ArsR family transcriptional regulator, arsenate/arsenite/antimonite-responsive transcriptional repressor